MLGGYTFAGWNTAFDGTGTQQATGSTFTMGSDNVTLYAQWKIPTYTVTYNSNGASSGSAPTDPNAYWNGDTLTVLSNTGSMALSHPMLGGYTFAGWNTAFDGTGTQQATG